MPAITPARYAHDYDLRTTDRDQAERLGALYRADEERHMTDAIATKRHILAIVESAAPQIREQVDALLLSFGTEHWARGSAFARSVDYSRTETVTHRVPRTD